MPRALIAAIDFALVLVFCAIGRASHHESLDLAGLFTTAYPFLVGWLAGTIGWMTNGRFWPWWMQGLVMTVAVVAIGMAARNLMGQGVQLSFVVVAAIANTVFLMGWRGIAELIGRTRGVR